MSTTRPVALLAILALALSATVAQSRGRLPRVQPNDNRTAAGRLSGDTLHLRLVIQMADWYPESDTGPVLAVAAIGEEGKSPQVPAPLIRVREGTIVVASIRNELPDSAVTMLGLAPHAGVRDTLVVRRGETQTVVFDPGVAGTYVYRARIGRPARNTESHQAGGAFIVDPRTSQGPVVDRVFVINIWGRQVDSTRYSNTLTINGRSWPWTERVEAVVGDTLRWRVVNASGRPHPMHLHGAYFRVESKGHIYSDTTFAPAAQRLVVTEDLHAFQTMSMAWAPVNAGRWLFHCHITFHVFGDDARLHPAPKGHTGHEHHMAGLVLGIDARDAAGPVLAGRPSPRKLDLFVQEGRPVRRAKRAMGFVLQRGATPPRADSTEVPGSLLVLTRDQPTDVTVHNRLKEATSVHWHGLELESFSDGVAGFGGEGSRQTPAVEPGASFTARLSMPRAGTFIYHTHLNDMEQLVSGMYGPIVVLEPGQRFDPARDHVHIIGWDASGQTDVQLLVNGDSLESPPIHMRVGERHRLRFINIGMAERGDFTLKRDTTLAQWTPIAKDGAELPASQRPLSVARLQLDVGQTADVEFIPDAPGDYVLSTPTDEKGRRWIRRVVVR